MIVFYKVQNTNSRLLNTRQSATVSTRVKPVKKPVKKITKVNKKFLQAIGFKT